MEYIEPLKNFIKPEILVLVPVLYFIGMAIKRSKKIKNENIPLLIGLIGIAIATLYVAATCEVYGVQGILMAIFTAITQGVLVAGASVYVDQLIKQKRYSKEDAELKKDLEEVS